MGSTKCVENGKQEGKNERKEKFAPKASENGEMMSNIS